MSNSYQYFENRECQYYPCHKGVDSMNCLFCYCPLYSMEQCPGNYRNIGKNDKKRKDCSDCTFPHKKESYEVIIKLLSEDTLEFPHN